MSDPVTTDVDLALDLPEFLGWFCKNAPLQEVPPWTQGDDAESLGDIFPLARRGYGFHTDPVDGCPGPHTGCWSSPDTLLDRLASTIEALTAERDRETRRLIEHHNATAMQETLNRMGRCQVCDNFDRTHPAARHPRREGRG